ncbi:MAG: S8 family serine peptidase [Rhodothermales bacterium]|nr:S8 family serine peptidase [Rhodothermales bacterium]
MMFVKGRAALIGVVVACLLPLFSVSAQPFDPVEEPLYPYQYYLHAINIEAAWEISKGSSDVVVAIIDEGLTDHEEIHQDRILEGIDFWDGDSDARPFGNGSHGVASAGIVGAAHNGKGIAGIAPEVKFIPVRILERNELRGSTRSARMQSIADAIDYSWQNGADVILMGWGLTDYDGDPSHPAYASIVDALERAATLGRSGLGSILVAAVGNHAVQLGNFAAFPASVPQVISVGSVDQQNEKWYYSVSAEEVDIVAQSGDLSFGPDLIVGGCAVQSSDFFSIDLRGDVWTIEPDRSSGDWDVGWNPGSAGVCENGYTRYTWSMDGRNQPDPLPGYTAHFGGTSAAAPQIAGVASLMLVVNQNLHAEEVAALLRDTATDLGDEGCDTLFGCGIINAGLAVEMAAGSAIPTGITSATLPEETRVFPNPASSRLFVQNTSTNTHSTTVHVVDVTGRTMIFGDIEPTGSIDVSRWPAGMYFYRVMSPGSVHGRGTFSVIR